MQGSGVFFALKIQSAHDRQQLDDMETEVKNLCGLWGDPNIIQIKDHALSYENLCVVILMELGVANLHEVLRDHWDDYSLGVAEIHSIFGALVRSVDSVHKCSIIHRDLKPQNFILVPMTSWDGKIFATTATPRDQFVFRWVKENHQEQHCSREKSHDRRIVISGGFIEVVLTDSSTGELKALKLCIKLADFGMARALDVDASHLTVRDLGGTVLFMAPEALRPTATDGGKQLSKLADIWSLGVMLFQMLHRGKTPFQEYHRANGRIGAMLATATETAHLAVMKFDRERVWSGELETMRAEFLKRTGTDDNGSEPAERGEDGSAMNGGSSTSSTELSGVEHVVLIAWVRTEFLFRVCESCLTFRTSDRIETKDLRQWMEHSDDENELNRVIRDFCDEESVRAILSSMDDTVLIEDDGEHDSGSANAEISRIGGRIGQALFPELWRREIKAGSNGNSVAKENIPSSKTGSKSAPPHSFNEREDLDGRIVTGKRLCLALLLVCLVALIVGCTIAVSAFFHSDRRDEKKVHEQDVLPQTVSSSPAISDSSVNVAPAVFQIESSSTFSACVHGSF